MTASALLLLVSCCKPDPAPGTVDLVGDSISVQAVVAGDGLENQPGDLALHVGLGWTASDALPWVEDQVAGARPESLVVAFGTNDAAPRGGGWTSDDVVVWVDLLDAPHPDACVVVILPALGDGARRATVAQVETARESIVTIARRRDGPTVVLDWATVIAADSSVLASDGVHLAPDPDHPYNVSTHAAEARLSQYWEGVERCQDLRGG